MPNTPNWKTTCSRWRPNDDPITIYVSSPGGHVESGDVIYDIIKFIKPQVRVVGTGWVASAATTIFLAASKENRFALPNTRFLIHQPLGGSRGDATDIKIQAEQIVKTRERINQLIAEETGQPLDRVAEDTDRECHHQFCLLAERQHSIQVRHGQLRAFPPTLKDQYAIL